MTGGVHHRCSGGATPALAPHTLKTVPRIDGTRRWCYVPGSRNQIKLL